MRVYVGTYTEPIVFGTGKVLQGKGEGVYAFSLDSAGALRPLATTTGIANPSYLAFDRSQRFLYAVNELKTYDGEPSGTVSAFTVDPRTGSLALLNRQLTHGTDPCHVAVDDARKHVFVANFASGSVCVLPVRHDGSLGAACDFVQHVGSGIDPRRQGGPHAHSVTLDSSGRFAWVPDLGLDKLMIYRIDGARGMLEPGAMPWIKTKPGAGPRHVAFHPSGRIAYLVNELDSTIDVIAHDGFGRVSYVDTVGTLPRDFRGDSTCADIQIAPSGRFVYASNRGHDSLAVFRVDAPSGRLELAAHEPTLGRTPRSFAIGARGDVVIVANQDSDSLVVFRVDAESGRLQRASETAVPTPVCVKLLDER